MSVLPFRAVGFTGDDVVTRDELDALQSNYQWINDNTPRGRFYRSNGNTTDVRLVMLSGQEKIPQNNKASQAYATVKFGKAFSPNCRPHVTTGIVCDFTKKVFCTILGPGGNEYPDSTGFNIRIDIGETSEKKDKIASAFWIHWTAFGYRADDMNEF